MSFERSIFSRFAMALVVMHFLAACAGSGLRAVSSVALSPSPLPLSGSIVLTPPVLSFSDTGLSVSDGVTRNGLWEVESADMGWEFSLDRGTSWTRGTSSFFEVKDDGAKVIWVRARDDAGNTSEIVRVNCFLDTHAPESISISHQLNGVTKTLKFSNLEPGGRWEYALGPHGEWTPGKGAGIAIFGNDLDRVWLRQVDLAGNVSAPQSFELKDLQTPQFEASNDPLLPTVLAQGLQTFLVHGVVSKGDSDFVRWDIPKGQQLLSVKWTHLPTQNSSAFYALQADKVFDTGSNLSRTLLAGPLDSSNLKRNLISHLPPSKLGEGPMTLMVQQNDPKATNYLLEIILSP